MWFNKTLIEKNEFIQSKNDFFHGIHKFYVTNGRLIAFRIYEKGKIIKTII